MKPTPRRILLFAAFALALAMGVDGWQWYALARDNAVIAGRDASARDTPHARYARAYRHAERGETAAALALYKQVAAGGPERLRAEAWYNSGNLHLREALALDAGQADQALPLLELAKRSYREALRSDPRHWDARYNLERALRLAPEVEEAEAEAPPPPVPSERAVTTMKGFTLGLP